MKTDVTIISTNINRKLLNNYKDYYVIDNNFSYSELLKYDKVVFFNVLNNLNDSDLIKLFKFLRDNNIFFINISNNMETSLYTDYLIIYDAEKILIEGKTLEVLKNEKIIKRLGLQLPFMVELSLLLKDYDLINKIYLDKESLVTELWK